MADSSGKKKSLFDISPAEEQGKEEVLEAAALLKKFVSKVGPMSGEATLDELGARQELENASTEPMLQTIGREEKRDHLDSYLERAYRVSESLNREDGPLIVPRLVSKIPGEVGPKVESIRLRYKGKATKSQLERVKRKLKISGRDI